MSVNFDWSIILIRKSFGASRHISEKLGVKLAIPALDAGYHPFSLLHLLPLWYVFLPARGDGDI